MNLIHNDPLHFQFLRRAAALAGLLLGILAGGLPCPAFASQVLAPTITAYATQLNSTTDAVTNLFGPGKNSYETAGQGACSGPLVSNVTDGTWVEMDFGTNVTFDRFIIATIQDTTDIVGTNTLYVGTNPVHSANDPYIISFSSPGDDSSGLIRYVGPVTGRYVRWEVTSSLGTTQNLGARHMWFLSTPPNSVVLPSPAVITNSTTAEYSTTYPPGDLTDGNCGNGINATIHYEYAEKQSTSGLPMEVFDFGAPTNITGFDFLNREADVISAFNLIFSDDPTFAVNITTNSWTCNTTNGNVWNSGAFGPIAARYVKLQATATLLIGGGTPNPGGREIIFYGPNAPLPIILQQPVARTNVNGTAFSLSVSVQASALTNYFQWQFNETNLTDGPSISGTGATVSGSAANLLSVNNALPGDSGQYSVIVSNIYGAVTSTVSSVSVFTAPVFTIEPVSTNAFLYAGETLTVPVATEGSQPITYYWYLNNVLVPIVTNTTFTISNIQQNGSYYVIASNSLGTATSAVVSFTVIPAPTSPYPLAVLNDQPLGFWPLNEVLDNSAGNDGRTAFDYASGNNGVYSNTILGLSGYASDLAAEYGYSTPTDTNSSAEFGYYPSLPSTNSYVGQIANINFGASTAPSFSVEAWVNERGNTQTSGAGIVSKGFGGGGEQFDLDYDGGWRFLVRNTAAGTTSATLAASIDSKWHHLVGVVDAVHTNLVLYVDGVARGTSAFTPTNGILNSSYPVVIGARTDSTISGYNLNFDGTVQNVAIYNYALSAAQVANHYYSAGIGPTVAALSVSSTNVSEGTTLVIPATVSGSPVLALQWLDITLGSPGTPVPGQTNATLVISNITAANYNGHTLDLLVTNIYGQVTSSQIQISVQAGAPSSVTITPSSLAVYAGVSVPFTVTEQGTIPFSFQWSTNGVNVPGATTSAFTYAAPSVGSYTVGCAVTNPVGPSSPPVVTASVTALAPPADNYGATVLADGPMAFWRLDEPPNSSTANDYVGGHDATYYSVVNGQPGFRPITIPSETASVFGTNGITSASAALENNNTGSGIPLIDFSTQGSNAEFSVEAWIQAPPGQNSTGAGIVSKGYGGGGEQFVLDTGGAGAGAFRFFIRNAAGTSVACNSGIFPDSNWHHLVGVCDEAGGALSIYVDGVMKAQTAIAAGTGILSKSSSTFPVVIGSRTLNVNDNYSAQLINASMDEVALYPYPLSSNQVVAHFNAAPEPLLITGLPAVFDAVAGVNVQLIPLVSGGIPPYQYQWQENGANIPGATGNLLTLSNAGPAIVGNYNVIVSDSPYLAPATSSVVAVTIVPDLTFNTNGSGWTLNQGDKGAPLYVNTNVLQLTSDVGDEWASSFYGGAVYIGSFEASWTYQDVTTNGANGMAFVLENDPRGATAIGSITQGNQLGYGGTGAITNSAALEFNIYSTNVGCSFDIDGAVGPYLPTGAVNIASGDPIGVNVLYVGGVLTMTLTDPLTNASYTTNASIDLPAVLGGNTAYVGFTAGDGAVASTQIVSNFTFISLVGMSIQTSGNTALISWPAGVGGYVLQQNSDLAATNWVNVTNSVSVVGGQNQVAAPVAGTATFYKLSLQ